MAKIGHADKFSDDMFMLKVEDRDFAVKPMNCPMSCAGVQSRAKILSRSSITIVRIRKLSPKRTFRFSSWDHENSGFYTR